MTLGRNTEFTYKVTPQSFGQQHMQGELITRAWSSPTLSAEVITNRNIRSILHSVIRRCTRRRSHAELL